MGFFFLPRVAILNPARKALQEEPSLSWILAAGKDTQKALDRSFFRKWAMSLAGASGRMHKVGHQRLAVRQEGGQAEERGVIWGCLAFSLFRVLELCSLFRPHQTAVLLCCLCYHTLIKHLFCRRKRLRLYRKTLRQGSN